MERRLAAILAADAVGYSTHVERDEARAVRAVRGHLEAIDLIISLHQGRVVKTLGDGLLAEFASVVDACSCAFAIQQGIAERTAPEPAEARILFRIGLHVDEILIDNGDILGAGVNVAARIEALAPAGGIAVSGRVLADLDGRLPVTAHDLGPHQLKNISRPVEVHVVTPADRSTGHQSPAPVVSVLPEKPSIAVLPFANLSTDPEQDFFVDGLAEDIIAALAQVPSLFVIARNSSFTYKGSAVDVRQVGRDLGVRYLLEGSARRAGLRLRVTGRLLDAETGAQLWSNQFDGTVEDVFELQDQIAQSVVMAVAPRIQSSELERVVRKRPDTLTAYELVLRAQAALNTARVSDAADLLEQALEKDPGYAKAMAILAWCHTVLIAWADGRKPDSEIGTAAALAERALDLAPDDVEVMAYAGYALSFFGIAIDRGLDLVRTATRLAPSFAWGWTSLAMLEAVNGDPEAALEPAQNALRLSPRDPMVFRTRVALASALEQLGRYAEAAEHARLAAEAAPRALVARCHYIVCLSSMGQAGELARQGQLLLASHPDFSVSNWIAHIRNFRTKGLIAERFETALKAAGLPD